MRDNVTAMDKLRTDAGSASPQGMTAIDDLKMYQKFSEAHVAGLKNLIASFDSLYFAMPDAQKKSADMCSRLRAAPLLLRIANGTDDRAPLPR
jgi:hypothetical protein